MLILGGLWPTTTDILVYDPVEKEWQKIGDVDESKLSYALSVISLDEILPYCM